MEGSKENWGEVFEPPKNEGEQKPEVTPGNIEIGGLTDKQKENQIEKSPEAAEVKKEIEAMPREEKMGLGRGIKSVGLYAVKGKSEFFADTIAKVSGKTSKESKTLNNFLDSLEETYRRDAKNAEKKLEEARKGQTHGIYSTAVLSGNLVKYGRVVGDVVGFTAAMPARYAMLGSLGFARIAEAGKEAQFKREDLINKTRIQDADQAAEEAWKIYRAAAEKNDEQLVTSEDLQAAYNKNLPADLLERINKGSVDEKINIASHIIHEITKREMEFSIGRMRDKFTALESNQKLNKTQRETQEEKIMAKYERRLKDWDRMVGQYGTVDALAAGCRYAEYAGKGAALLLGAETVIAGAIHGIANLFGHSDLSRAAETATATHAAGTSGLHPNIEQMHGNGQHPFATTPADRLNQPTSAHIGPMPQEAAPEIPHGTPVPVPEAVVHPEYSVTIGEHGSAWEAARHIGLNEKEFAAAWGNPESVVHTAAGDIHVPDANLVHSGDIVNYVPGKNGGIGHFEITPASGQHVGTGIASEFKPSDMRAGPSQWDKDVPKIFGNPSGGGQENLMGYPDHPPVIPTHPDHPPGSPIWENQHQEAPVIQHEIPQTEVIQVHADNVNGEVTFNFDKQSGLMHINDNVNVSGLTPDEYFSKDFVKIVNNYAVQRHLDAGFKIDQIEMDGRLLATKIKIYKALLNDPRYIKETFALNQYKMNIQNLIQIMIKTYGGTDIFDKTKLAEFMGK